MATRQVKLMGYTSDNINLSLELNDVTVFNGAITPLGSQNDIVELASFTIDQTVDGNIPASITVTNGNVTIVTLSATHTHGTEDSAFSWIAQNSNQSKNNVSIDGVLEDRGVVGDLDGAWHNNLTDGQTMTCNFAISATPAAGSPIPGSPIPTP